MVFNLVLLLVFIKILNSLSILASISRVLLNTLILSLVYDLADGTNKTVFIWLFGSVSIGRLLDSSTGSIPSTIRRVD